MRIVCHSQFLTGVGHFVRMHLIASGLAQAHEVYLVDGNQPVPRRSGPAEPRRLPLPVMARHPSGDLVDAQGGPAGPALRRRADILTEAIREIRPDALLVDHYPFSRWEFETEIGAAIRVARRVNPDVRIFCSVRDLVPKERFQQVDAAEHTERVLRLLERFDGVLVHSDPAFARLEDTFPRTGSVPVPVTYTGFVAEQASPPPAGTAAPWAVVSAGGTAATPFLTAAVSAFADLHRAGSTGAIRLHVFQGPADNGRGADELRRAGEGAPVELHSFSPDYSGFLRDAALSISRAGYNTSAALLRARVPALVVPNPRLSDQPPRATRLAAAGLAHAVEGEHPAPSALAAPIEKLLDAPRPRHDLDLDGVAATRRLVEAWSGISPRPDAGLRGA